MGPHRRGAPPSEEGANRQPLTKETLRTAIRGPVSLLTSRAEEGRAAALHNAADLAITAGAGLSFPVIDLELLREVAQLAIGRGKVLQRRAAGPDRLFKDGRNGLRQHVELGPADLAGRFARINSSSEQRLTGIDVAEASDDP